MIIKAVFFDIDGTLVDSNDQHVTVWQRIFRDEGHDFDREQIHGQIGKGADNLVPTLLPGTDEATHSRLGDTHGAMFKRDFLNKIRPFAGAHDLLKRVKQSGRQVVLASSASSAELDHYLRLLDAREIVSASTSADDVESTKPAPDIFLTALRALSPLQPQEVIVVGDTPYDVEAASGSGMAAIALRAGGFDDAVLQEAGAIRLYDDTAALLADFEASHLNK